MASRRGAKASASAKTADKHWNQLRLDYVRATPKQRDAILRIMSGEDSEPGATFLGVYSSMLEKVHEPVFAQRPA